MVPAICSIVAVGLALALALNVVRTAASMSVENESIDAVVWSEDNGEPRDSLNSLVSTPYTDMTTNSSSYSTKTMESGFTPRNSSLQSWHTVRISQGFEAMGGMDLFTTKSAGNDHLQNMNEFQSTIPTSTDYNCGNVTNLTSCDPDLTSGGVSMDWRSVALGLLLGFFCIITISGNLLVIIAVSRERYLRSVTNFLVVSLACADIIVGVLVMPFAITMEITQGHWYFGLLVCDLWHSFDVLGSTASILNLCVISLDRYWAVSDPIQYPRKMSRFRATLSIVLVWLCSSLISFPAIAWWREVMPSNVKETQCLFTENTAYLILSSMVSFYIPLFIMIFVYLKIYRTAVKQIESFKTGSKKFSHSGGKNGVEVLLLRVHRGGTAHLTTNGTVALEKISCANQTGISSRESSSENFHYHGGDCNSNSTYNSHGSHNAHSTATFIKRKLRNFAVKKKLSKIARERKAAKTLGIVMGVFVVCWLPFFIMNLLLAICSDCVSHVEIVFPVFTWLGYINSGMNPVIYACSMKDFRRAFIRILCAFSSKRRNRMYMKRLRNKRYRSSEFYSSSCLSGLASEYTNANIV